MTFSRMVEKILFRIPFEYAKSGISGHTGKRVVLAASRNGRKIDARIVANVEHFYSKFGINGNYVSAHPWNVGLLSREHAIAHMELLKYCQIQFVTLRWCDYLV